MRLDLRIRGGRVHLPPGPARLDVLVAGERVAGLVSPDADVATA